MERIEIYNADRDAFRSEGGFLRVNRKLITTFGLVPANILANLVEKDCYFNPNKADWFFLTHAHQLKELNISIFALRQAKTMLIDCDVIQTKMIGVPAKEYYKINYKTIKILIGQGVAYSVSLEMPDSASLGIADSASLGIADSASLINKTKLIHKTKLKNIFASSSSGSEEEELSLHGNITPNQFDEFWSIYPRKNNKGDAKTTWNKLCSNKKKKEIPKWREIRKALLLQKETEVWVDTPQYIPYASRWLNNSHWLNDPDEMKSFTKNDVRQEDEDDSWKTGSSKPNWKV